MSPDIRARRTGRPRATMWPAIIFACASVLTISWPAPAAAALLAGGPLTVDIADWINDTFPANEAVVPGTANFDTCSALVKTGRNIAQVTNDTLRFDVPGDSVVVMSPKTARVDLVFRILPGPGNYQPIGRPDIGTIRKIPQSPALVTKGDLSFWDSYRQQPGDFASPNAVTLHHNAVGGWDPSIWNSARCDTAEMNLAALQRRGILGGPADVGVWMATYHESDPHFNLLGITHNRCYVRCTTCVLTDIRCDGGQPDDYNIGSSTTKEGTKIIPDGILTPGSHVEYFFRRQISSKAPGQPDGLLPDTNVVMQPGEGSTDGHRWQEFSVLPNRWKASNYKHPVTQLFGLGPACLLVVDANDRRGNERVWVGIADTIGATPQRYWGAHNGWHAIGGGNVDNPADNRRGTDNSPGFVAEHLGQAGSGATWDMYQVKASELGTARAGGLGSRLSNRSGSAGQQIVIAKSSRQGPTSAMLAAYYNTILFLSGDLNNGVLGPYANQSANDAGLIMNWLGGGVPAAPRGFWAIGDGFAESNIAAGAGTPQQNLMLNYLGTNLVHPNYCQYSGDNRALIDFQTFIGAVGTRGMRNLCSNDVLTRAGIGLQLGTIASKYSDPGGTANAGILKGSDSSSPWKALVDGWDIENLTGQGDVNTIPRSCYFYSMFSDNSIWRMNCIVAGTPMFALSSYYRDVDGDGYGNAAVSTQDCSVPAGYVANNTDCNDNNSAVHPGVLDVCNGTDDNCNGLVDDGALGPSGLVAWWKAEGNASDATGQHGGSLVNGATFAAGNVGQAFSLDGANDYVSVPHSSAFNFSNAFTVEGWIKSASDGADRYIITKGDDSFYLAIGGGYVDLHKLSFYLNGVTSNWLRGTTSLDDNQWHHVAGTYDGSNVKVYVDGQVENTLAMSGNMSTGTNPVIIGARVGINYFAGSLDELAIYGRALTQSEIQAIHHAASGGRCALVAVNDSPASAHAFEFAAPWPNPAARVMNFEIELPSPAVVRADVVDVAGRRVASLVENEAMPAGKHRLRWDGRDASGRRVTSGVYLVRVSAGAAAAVHRFVVIK